MMKKIGYTYGLGFAVVAVLCLCVYSLFTISRASIITIPLDDPEKLKEVSMRYECADSL